MATSLLKSKFRTGSARSILFFPTTSVIMIYFLRRKCSNCDVHFPKENCSSTTQKISTNSKEVHTSKSCQRKTFTNKWSSLVLRTMIPWTTMTLSCKLSEDMVQVPSDFVNQIDQNSFRFCEGCCPKSYQILYADVIHLAKHAAQNPIWLNEEFSYWFYNFQPCITLCGWIVRSWDFETVFFRSP